MMKSYYHGTSADAWAQIQKDGKMSVAVEKLWNVSRSANYFWEPEALVIAENGKNHDYSVRNMHREAFRRASESAQVASCVSVDCRLVVLRIEYDENDPEVYPDDSCEGMNGAFCRFEDIPVDDIKEVWISNDLSLLKGYFLMLAMRHENFVYPLFEFTNLELKVAKAFQTAEIYLEDVEEWIEWKPIAKYSTGVLTKEDLCP